MPTYTLIILGTDRDVRAVRQIHADTNEAARGVALDAFAQHEGALRIELWYQDERVWAEHPKPTR